MKKHYLCITNAENWEVVRRRKVWGVPDRHKKIVNQIRNGDTMVFYVKPNKIAGVFEVVSELFEDDSPIFDTSGFDKNERFKNRIKLTEKIILSEPLDIKPLVPSLSFIKRKDNKWATSLFGRAILEIPKTDLEYTLKAIREDKKRLT